MMQLVPIPGDRRQLAAISAGWERAGFATASAWRRSVPGAAAAGGAATAVERDDHDHAQ